MDGAARAGGASGRREHEGPVPVMAGSCDAEVMVLEPISPFFKCAVLLVRSFIGRLAGVKVGSKKRN